MQISEITQSSLIIYGAYASTLRVRYSTGIKANCTQQQQPGASLSHYFGFNKLRCAVNAFLLYSESRDVSGGWDSARRRSLRRSRSFKVTDFGINGIQSRTVLELSLSSGQIVAFDERACVCLLLIHPFSLISKNIAVSHLLLNQRLWIQVCCREFGSVFTTRT